jgi:hypothetical protein
MLTARASWLLVAMTATAACAGGDRDQGGEADAAAGREVALDVLIDDARGVRVVAIYPVAELPPLVGAGGPSLGWQLEADGDPIASGTFADPRLLHSVGTTALRSSFGIAALRVPERAGELVILDGDAELGRAAFDPGIGLARSPLLRAGDVRGGPVRILGDLDRATAVDVLVLPEGYTAAQLGRFRRDALQISRAFRGVMSSQRRLGGRFNVWVQDVRSRSSGIDDPAGRRIADTAFDVGFGAGDGRRCTFFQTPDGLASARQLGRMAGADVVMVLAHTAEHGGCAGPGVVVMTHGRRAPWTMAHELGHALVGLADEYEGGGACRHDPAPNIAFSSDRGRIPWGRPAERARPAADPGDRDLRRRDRSLHRGPVLRDRRLPAAAHLPDARAGTRLLPRLSRPRRSRDPHHRARRTERRRTGRRRRRRRARLRQPHLRRRRDRRHLPRRLRLRRRRLRSLAGRLLLR